MCAHRSAFMQVCVPPVLSDSARFTISDNAIPPSRIADASLVELPSIYDRMSVEQRADFDVADLMLTAIFMVCVFGALIFSALLLAVQLAIEGRQQLREVHAEKGRRLRWLKDGSKVRLDSLPAGHYHLFLSQYAPTRAP